MIPDEIVLWFREIFADNYQTRVRLRGDKAVASSGLKTRECIVPCNVISLAV
ncbi:hypothetical protein FBZ96_1031230 [Bradyrhizobium stylosanthis]|uniref:Uncharacterized protein n=1 Tax=Bradyrhizobium stylosanthis TaxID=1803665 RepID=A0A560DZA9_9BRAD|nr:hypothetical protein FBZ96_1031230 [Bradyrhizobium stylosanthis]